MSAPDVLLAIALVTAASSAVRLTWKVRTVSAFLAGGAAGVVVVVDSSGWALVAIAVGAVVIAECFALRTRGLRTDDGRPTAWPARLGASWLVLVFPAVMVWCSFQAVHWMLSRI
jgi:hypothetical protein